MEKISPLKKEISYLVNEYGKSLLSYSIIRNDTELFNDLIKQKIAILTRDEHGNSALHEAARNDSPYFIKKLRKPLGGVNPVNNQGHTPLHICCERGNCLSLELLIDLGGGLLS
ncbi:MAG: ankyrin repeat domain-containing protein [Chlamydiota bacterium]